MSDNVNSNLGPPGAQAQLDTRKRARSADVDVDVDPVTLSRAKKLKVSVETLQKRIIARRRAGRQAPTLNSVLKKAIADKEVKLLAYNSLKSAKQQRDTSSYSTADSWTRALGQVTGSALNSMSSLSGLPPKVVADMIANPSAPPVLPIPKNFGKLPTAAQVRHFKRVLTTLDKVKSALSDVKQSANKLLERSGVAQTGWTASQPSIRRGLLLATVNNSQQYAAAEAAEATAPADDSTATATAGVGPNSTHKAAQAATSATPPLSTEAVAAQYAQQVQNLQRTSVATNVVLAQEPQLAEAYHQASSSTQNAITQDASSKVPNFMGSDGVFNWNLFAAYIRQQMWAHLMDVQMAEQRIAFGELQVDISAMTLDSAFTQSEVEMERTFTVLNSEMTLLQTQDSNISELTNILMDVKQLNPSGQQDTARVTDATVGPREDLLRGNLISRLGHHATGAPLDAEHLPFMGQELDSEDLKTYDLSAGDIAGMRNPRLSNEITFTHPETGALLERSVLSEPEIKALRQSNPSAAAKYDEAVASLKNRRFKDLTGIYGVYEEEANRMEAASKAAKKHRDALPAGQERDAADQRYKVATEAAADLRDTADSYASAFNEVLSKVARSYRGMAGLNEKIEMLCLNYEQVKKDLEVVIIREQNASPGNNPAYAERHLLIETKRDMERKMRLLQRGLAAFHGGDTERNQFIAANHEGDQPPTNGPQSAAPINGRTRRFNTGEAQLFYDGVRERLSKPAMQLKTAPLGEELTEADVSHNIAARADQRDHMRQMRALLEFQGVSPAHQREVVELFYDYRKTQATAKSENVLLEEFQKKLQKYPHVSREVMLTHIQKTAAAQRKELSQSGNGTQSELQRIDAEEEVYKNFWNNDAFRKGSKGFVGKGSIVPPILRRAFGKGYGTMPKPNVGPQISQQPTAEADRRGGGFTAQRNDEAVPEALSVERNALDPTRNADFEPVDFMNKESLDDYYAGAFEGGRGAFKGLEFTEYNRLTAAHRGIQSLSQVLQDIPAYTSAPLHEAAQNASALVEDAMQSASATTDQLEQTVERIVQAFQSAVNRPRTW